MSIFDNLDMSGVGASAGANPFAFMQTPTSFDTAPPAAPPPAAAPQGLLPDDTPPAANPMDSPTPPQGFGGFLSRLAAPSPDGLTLGDKLFAAGQMLKGEDASKYLEARRTGYAKTQLEQQKQKDADEKQKRAQQGAQVVADSWDDDGNFNFRKYTEKMAALGLQPTMEDIARAASLRTKLEAINMGAKGGAFWGDPYAGTTRQAIAPIPEAEPGFRLTATGEEPIPGGSKDLKTIEGAAAARRRGAPPVGRAAPATGYSSGYKPFHG